MGSVTDSVGSGRSNVRRYSGIQTCLQRWNNGSSHGEFPPMLPHLRKVRTQVTRTPALDLAKQAQLAACNYLGYSPRDLPSDLFCPQGLSSDTHRPVELHMHHFHHHYVASPTSPFSQTSSQCCEPPAGDNPGAPTTELALRVSRPVPPNTVTSTTTVYPAALGLRGPSVGPQLMHTLQGGAHIQNSSQALLNGTSVGDVEAAHRYMENILWLKSQIGHAPDQIVNQWKDRRGATTVESEKRIMGIKPRPSMTSERRPIRRAKKLCRPRDGHDTPDSTSERRVACCRKPRPKTPSDSALLLEKCEKMRAIQNQNSPCNSLLEDSSATDESARSGSLSPVTLQRTSPISVKMRKTKIIENREKCSTMGKPQGIVRSDGCLLSPWWPFPRGRNPKSHSARSLRDDTTSSPENDSVCSSGKVSATRRSVWTCTSSSTESDNLPRVQSPPGRPANKGCGARAPRKQASKEARAWDTTERKTRKISSYRSETRPEASVQPISEYEYEIEYEIDSESKAEEKDLEDRNSNVPEENSSLQDRCMDEKERWDGKELRVRVLGSKTRVLTEVENPKKAWAPSVKSNRGPQHVPAEHDRMGTDKPNLHEPPRCSFPPRTIENKSGGYNSAHNRLREAVEAAWNTNLRTKNDLEDYCIKASQGRKCTDLYSLRDHRNDLCQFSGEEKAHLCEETWKARPETKKGVEEDCKNRVPGGPTFQKAYRDHENLKALVAREESLQRELEDQTVARVAAEERARVAAEQKADIYEASAKAAEEGLRVLLDERALFHSKFKEEIEKGATDRLRLQELLHLEKLKLEATERELREVRRSFQDSLAGGARAVLPSKTSLQPDPTKRDGLSVHAVEPHVLGAGIDEGHWQLRSEAETRIRAEAKASHFEATAKAAEEKLRSLLDERNWFYAKFKEELEQNNTDMKKLQQLMELEKSNNGHEDPSQKRKPDVRPLSVPNSLKRNLDIKTEDGEGVRHSEVHYKASFRSKREEALRPEDKDRHRLEQPPEFKELPGKLFSSDHRPEAEISDFKQAEECWGEDRMSASSADIFENSDVRYVKVSNEKSSIRNEKKRPLSPISGSRMVGLRWKSPERPLSLKIERCNSMRDGEATTVLDISPGSSRLDSVDLHFRENPESPNDCQSAAEDSFDFEENGFDREKSARPAVESHAEMCHVNGGPLMSLPSKWKKETKAELRKMIQEQEMTWKIAEDAVEELGRRLEMLERYKMEIQDTLGRTRTTGKIDGFFKRLKENLEDFPGGFNSLYNSPIYEEAKALYNCSPLTKKEGRGSGRILCQDVCTSPTRPEISKDSQIEKLKEEIAQLRVELRQRASKRADSPKSKGVSPRSAPSTGLSPSPPSPPMVVPDWSTNFLSGFETPTLKKEDTCPLPLISLGNHNMPEDMEPELLDSSFEKLKTITIPAIQNGSKENSNGKVDQLEPMNVYTSRTIIDLEVDDRRWVPIPDNSQDTTAAPTCMENGIHHVEEMDYRERSAPQDIFLSVGLNPDEGELRMLETAVRKLSRIFLEQEEKLKKFDQRERKDAANISQTEDLRDLYLAMLKEMSQQLGELCHELHAITLPDEISGSLKKGIDQALQKEESTLRKCDPLEKIVKIFQHMEMMDTRGAITLSNDAQIVQQLQIQHEKPTFFSTEKIESDSKQSFKGIDEKPEDTMSESDLRAALKAAEKKIKEQKCTNLFLTEKLKSGSEHLSKLQAEHAQEVARRNHSIDYAQQLNSELSTEMTQTETSLAEIRSRYRALVSNLEQQLEEARKEAISLQDTVTILKDEIMGKENLVSSLEAEAQEHELQIVQLRSHLQTIQDESSANVRDKIELVDSLEAMRREVDEQHHRVTELISINEDLITFSESKEDEIKELTTTLKSLQQSVNEKSAEAARLSAEALGFSLEVVETRKEGEAYRLRWTALKSKVEEIEHELRAREASMERLTQHLGKMIEGQDIILEEKEQLLLSLNRAQYKEHRLDDQVRQSKIIIQDLEDKLNSMDAEINEARLELVKMKAKGMEALLIEKQAGEMRNRVHELEEEIMEKEGQISILKTSYPGEYTSTF